MIDRRAAAPGGAALVAPGPRAATRVVLIAERDQTVRALQRHFLELAGFSVVFADDGPGVFAGVREWSPLVVVTEILVPGVDGLTVCRRLHEDPLTRGIPVIVFSILSAAARAADAGAYAFLRKPLVQSTFVGAVEGAVAARAPERTEQPCPSP